MSELHLVRHCSPTLAGLKTGSMFSCSADHPVQLRDILRDINLRLKEKGLRVLPVRFCAGRVLIYVYRPLRLKHDLNNDTAAHILKTRGYAGSVSQYICHLIRRLGEDGEFPHEIGLFLGYPTEDVKGFIENPRACKYVGYWKVYGDEEHARRSFAKFRKCTAVYSRHYAMGKSLEKLTVSDN